MRCSSGLPNRPGLAHPAPNPGPPTSFYSNSASAAPARGRVAHDVFGVDCGCVLRTAERPIGLDGDSPGTGPRVDQVEREVRTGIGEQSCALADDDGIGEQVELVDQAVGEQP